MAETCRRANCERVAVAQGLCDADYRRARRDGGIQMRERDPAKRFWAKVDRTNACWPWMKALDPQGYGRVGWGGKVLLAHRVAYMLAVGPIPDGLQIDHRCHNEDGACPGGRACLHRRCVNPAHLRPTTNTQNMAGGRHPGAGALRTNFCINGHEFTAENTYTWKGQRYCRECTRARKRELPYVYRPRPSKVRTVEATCDVCGLVFQYEKISRARTVCSDECRTMRSRRASAAYKAAHRQPGRSTCTECGSDFEHQGRGFWKVCSDTCRKASRRRSMRESKRRQRSQAA